MRGLDHKPGRIKYYQGTPWHGGIMVYCPECESDLDIEEDEVDEGEVVSCPECGTDFEIITVNPLELKAVEELEEDEEEEEDEETEDGDV
jgi:alpha-aminoadipate/glutamate carrier protein LysW